MSLFTKCLLYCPICQIEYDNMKAYGGGIPCCSKECYKEAQWRHSLAIMGKEYRPQEKSKDESKD